MTCSTASNSGKFAWSGVGIRDGTTLKGITFRLSDFFNKELEHESGYFIATPLKSYLPTTNLNELIQSVSNTKFLGIYINDTINWKNHTDHILPKLSVTCHAMRIIKPYMSLETLRMVYHSTFHSVISYCLPFCGTSPQSKRVFLMQKRIIRIVLGRTRLASCRTLFKNLKILPLMSQYIFSIMMLIIKQNIILQLIQQFII